jgi:23S rRNA pseudouridine2605 synthase
VVLDTSKGYSLVQVELHEGRNRIVRRMFATAGYPVVELVRTQFGPIRLGTLSPGEVRVLGREDVGALMNVAGL